MPDSPSAVRPTVAHNAIILSAPALYSSLVYVRAPVRVQVGLDNPAELKAAKLARSATPSFSDFCIV
jgi:hypothetical protein